MVDIHSHIVWGVDDGAPHREESLRMLHTAWEGGTTDIVATPHANSRYPFRRELVLERVAALADATHGRPKVHFGCEFHLSFENVDQPMRHLRSYTINRDRYLLVECPDFHVGKHTETVLRTILEQGIVPIVAHPERNPVLRQNLARVEAWVELGCLLQLTALSIVGGFGGAAKSASYAMLDAGLIHIVASDAHDAVVRSPRMDTARQAVASTYGNHAADLLFTENPAAVVANHSVAEGRQLAFRRTAHWYQVWKTAP